MSFTGRGKICVLTLKCAIEHSYVTSEADEEKDLGYHAFHNEQKDSSCVFPQHIAALWTAKGKHVFR